MVPLGAAPDRSDLPLVDPARFGTGVYRRRVRMVTTAPGTVVAELEDDYHHFRATVTHDGADVTGCVGEAIRYPWGTCPGATGLLTQLVGMELSSSSVAVGGHADVAEQCTHLFDLAGLAVAHAYAGRERREYDMAVADRKGDVSEPRLSRDGEPLLTWTVEGDVITGPDPYAGVSLRRGFMAWASSELDPDAAEAAIVLRRATMISWGRHVSLDDVSRASELGIALQGRCHTFSEAHVEQAVRMRETTHDFTDHPERLLAD